MALWSIIRHVDGPEASEPPGPFGGITRHGTKDDKGSRCASLLLFLPEDPRYTSPDSQLILSLQTTNHGARVKRLDCHSSSDGNCEPLIDDWLSIHFSLLRHLTF